MRVGLGYDVHKLVEGRKLIIGGVNVPHEKGLLGHSDADVLIHAVMDSILGALALGDLGTFFPDNSDKTLGMDSKIILKECYKKVIDAGYHLNNLDLTIYSQNIKIAPIRMAIRESISNILNCPLDCVSVKATTYEKMGFIGRGEALACECVCLIETNE